MRRPLPGRFQHHAFTRAEALEAGLTDRRLRGSDLSAPFHGIRMSASADPSLLRLASAYQRRMRPEHAFSHSTATRLYGAPLPIRFGDLPLHVSCSAPNRAPEARNVVGHRLRPEVWSCGDVFVPAYEDGGPFVFRLTSPTLTWLLLGRDLGVPDLVAAADALVTSRTASVATLTAALDTWATGHGVRRLRAALPLVRHGSMSRPESLLRLQIIAAGLPEPDVNVPVYDRSGRLVFRPDLSWAAQRVLVEYEGDIHRLSQAKFRSDVHRMEAYADAGWAGIRAIADDVFRSPDHFVARLHRRLVERGLEPRALRQVAASRP